MGTGNRQRRAQKHRKVNRAAAHPRAAERSARSEFDPLLVRNMLISAAKAFREADLDLGAAFVAALEQGASGVHERRMVAEQVDVLGTETVRSVWRAGWQPADVARLVDRKVGARHGRFVVDVIAADARRYTCEPVAARWSDQLSALGAEVWWSSDEPHLEEWAVREGLSRTDALMCATEVLAVLLHLPSLPRLCDPPGEPRLGRAVRTARSAPGDLRMLDRVRALLAKAESTTFAEEAEALTLKAQELMARHSIDEAMIGVAGGPDALTIGVRVSVDDPYASAKSMLLSEVASANGSRSVWSRDLGFSTVFGFESDVDFVDVLYTSLLVQATSAMVAAGAQINRQGQSRTRSFRQSFLVAYAGRIGERLRVARAASEHSAVEEYGDALLPVLADRSAAVDEAVGAVFPRLATHSVAINNAAGWAAGKAAAELASLSARTEVARK
jgi:hypothetical protein